MHYQCKYPIDLLVPTNEFGSTETYKQAWPGWGAELL